MSHTPDHKEPQGSQLSTAWRKLLKQLGVENEFIVENGLWVAIPVLVIAVIVLFKLFL